MNVRMGKKTVRLDERDLLGVGGEGRVYKVGDRAVKIFFAMTDARKKKLAAFPRDLHESVIGPLELCTDGKGEIVGYAMRALPGAFDFHRVGHRKWREATMTAGDVVSLLGQLARDVDAVHAAGVIVGDLNDGNVVVTRDGGFKPWLIDADSMQIAGFPCVVAHERFLDPRLYGVDLSRSPKLDADTDAYALAVLAFASLLCVHPYGGTHASYNTLLRRAEARHSLLRGDVKLPAAAIRPDVLTDDVLAWFGDVFDRGARTALPASLLDLHFSRCSCGAEHARRACPLCTVSAFVAPPVRAKGKLRATSLVRGRVAAAGARGTWALADDEHDALVREDGTRLASRFMSREITRVTGTTTWVIGEGRARRFERAELVEDIPVGEVHGSPAADAGPAGLVYAQGDALLRASDGTRLGQILEGQTHVRVGNALGFAFYRAGALTVHFLFETKRGPLRQIELPPIEGRLVEWDVLFDDAHALFWTATEKDGKRTCSAHLVDARGDVLASTTSAPSTPAACIAGGAVLWATPDGLVLYRADRAKKTLTAARVFTDAKDLVPEDAELIVGPGGSLYVVTHDEIVHLCFDEGVTP